MPNVSAWFERVSKLEVVYKIAGFAKMCDKPVKPVDPTKLPKVEAVIAKVEAPKAEKKDDEFDPFADENEDDIAAAAATKKKVEEAKAKKVKPAVIAKSIIVWEVKTADSRIDIDLVAKKILGITMDGLVWKTQYIKEPVAYGVFKLIIGAVVEDLKVSTDDVEEAILAIEDADAMPKETI
jgi:translation elongation factor EF-1beta